MRLYVYLPRYTQIRDRGAQCVPQDQIGLKKDCIKLYMGTSRMGQAGNKDAKCLIIPNPDRWLAAGGGEIQWRQDCETSGECKQAFDNTLAMWFLCVTFDCSSSHLAQRKVHLLKVGNKCDRGGRRKVGVQEAKEWAERFIFIQ